MRSFKKIAAMIMAVAMLCSLTALADVATPVISAIAEITTANPELNLSYTSDAEQDTILVYAGTLDVANVVYIDQIANGSTVPTIKLDTAGPFGTHTVMIGGTDVATAGTATFTYTDARARSNVTLAIDDNTKGTVTYSGDSLTNVPEGTEITFTIVPYLGYELTSFKVGEDEMVEEIKNGVYTHKVGATDTTITPKFTAVTTNGGSLTYGELFTLAADGDDPASKLAFGQALNKTNAEIDSMGMYVEIWSDKENDYVDFYTIGDEHYGPYFAASNPTTENKYGIRFFSFEKGKYRISSYVKYVDEENPVCGDAIEFTVQ